MSASLKKKVEYVLISRDGATEDHEKAGTTRHVVGDSKEDGKAKDPRGPTKAVSLIPRGLTGGKKGARGMYGRYTLIWATDVSTNTSQPKYFAYLVSASGTAISPGGALQASVEWTSFDSVFDEFFIHSVKCVYKPVNAYGGALTDGATPQNQQFGPMAIAGYQHNQALPTDNSDLVRTLCTSSQSKFVESGKAFTWTWKNIEKFAKDGPVTDSGSSGYSQGWINVSTVLHYGGNICLGFKQPTGAAVGIGTWATSITVGSMLLYCDVSFRYRS